MIQICFILNGHAYLHTLTETCIFFLAIVTYVTKLRLKNEMQPSIERVGCTNCLSYLLFVDSVTFIPRCVNAIIPSAVFTVLYA